MVVAHLCHFGFHPSSLDEINFQPMLTGTVLIGAMTNFTDQRVCCPNLRLNLGPVATARGSDFVPNRAVSVAGRYRRGSDFVANRAVSVGPVATARGSDFVANRAVSVGFHVRRWGSPQQPIGY